MKTMLRFGSATLMTLALAPATCFARPIHPVSHTRTTTIQSRSPHIELHEPVVHHS